MTRYKPPKIDFNPALEEFIVWKLKREEEALNDARRVFARFAPENATAMTGIMPFFVFWGFEGLKRGLGGLRISPRGPRICDNLLESVDIQAIL